MDHGNGDNPYAAPPSTSDPRPGGQPIYSGAVRTDRSGAVLAMGICSLGGAVLGLPLIFCCCGASVPVHAIAIVCGVIGLILGHGDLQAIRAGELDPRSGANTRLGYYLSIAGVIIALLALLVMAGFFVFMFAVDSGRWANS